MMKLIGTAAAVLALAPAANAFPVVGGQGLVPNARAIVDYVRDVYPAVLSIGGVRPCDAIGDHCSGHAVDIMVGGNTALGDAINADILAQSARFGVRYTIWQQTQHTPAGAAIWMANRGSATANHLDHVHISVS